MDKYKPVKKASYSLAEHVVSSSEHVIFECVKRHSKGDDTMTGRGTVNLESREQTIAIARRFPDGVVTDSSFDIRRCIRQRQYRIIPFLANDCRDRFQRSFSNPGKALARKKRENMVGKGEIGHTKRVYNNRMDKMKV
jgi:hypothetical protein